MIGRGPTLLARAVITDGSSVVVAPARRGGRAHLTIPGGRVNPGETGPEAARRELAEELAIDVQVGALLYVAEVVAPHRRHDVNLIFRVEPGEGMGLGELERVGLAEVARQPVYPPILDQIADDVSNGWPPRARWLGNVWDPELAG